MIGVARIPTQQAVFAELPEIARLAHWSSRAPLGIDAVIGIGCILLEVDRELVDLDRRETGDRDVKAFHDQDLSEGGQLNRQALAVPAGIFSDLVVRKGERAPLGFRQPPYLDCRDSLETQQLSCCIAAVAGNNDTIVVNQNGEEKVDCLEAAGISRDWLARMITRFPPAGRELIDSAPANTNNG